MGKKSRLKRERRENPPFHLSIGTTISSDSSEDVSFHARHQMRLIKAGLLYADQVTLHSPLLHMLLAYDRLKSFSQSQQFELLRLIAPTLGASVEGVDLAQTLMRRLSMLDIRRVPASHRREIETLLGPLEEVEQVLNGFRAKGEDISQEFRLGELSDLIRQGRVDVQPFGLHLSDVEIVAGSIQSSAHLNQVLEMGQTQGETLRLNAPDYISSLMNEFFAQLQKIISSSKTYPLFDDFTGNLVRLGLQEGKLQSTNLQTDRAKHLGLAASLLERLPSFEEATAEELLDIQKDLHAPLVRFRKAMMEFSRKMKEAPWDAGFVLEAEEVFRAEVEPAVCEIEESLQSNKYLLEIWNRLPNQSLNVTGSSALGVGLAQFGFLGHAAAGALGSAVGAVILGADAWKSFQEKQDKIESNQLFFYYRAGRSLEKSDHH